MSEKEKEKSVGKEKEGCAEEEEGRWVKVTIECPTFATIKLGDPMLEEAQREFYLTVFCMRKIFTDSKIKSHFCVRKLKYTEPLSVVISDSPSMIKIISGWCRQNGLRIESITPFTFKPPYSFY